MYPEASESLKALLLVNEESFDGWHLRGAAFHHMDVPILADLHFRRVEVCLLPDVINCITSIHSQCYSSSLNRNLPNLLIRYDGK